MRTNAIIAIMAAIALTIMQGCSADNSARTFADRLSEANTALADGDYAIAQTLADDMLQTALGADSASIDEADAARLGILFMKLSERRNEDENVVYATQCIRRAFRLSNDSLKSFFATLPLEDTPQYVLLRRIGLSIDNPIELPVEADEAEFSETN